MGVAKCVEFSGASNARIFFAIDAREAAPRRLQCARAHKVAPGTAGSRHTWPRGTQGAHIGEPGRNMRTILRRIQRAQFRRNHRTGSGAGPRRLHALATMLDVVAPLPSPGAQGKDTAAPPFCVGQMVGPHARDPPTINVFAQSLAAGGSHGSDCAKKKIGRFLRFACNFSVNMSPTSPYSRVGGALGVAL